MAAFEYKALDAKGKQKKKARLKGITLVKCAND